MSINFKQVIIHTLDQEMGQAIISKSPLVMDDNQERFVTKKLTKVVFDSSLRETRFRGQECLHEDVEAMVNNWTDSKFYGFTEALANLWFRYQTEYGTIKDGDVIFISYNMDGINYLGALKINYKQEAAHYFDGEKRCAYVAENKAIYERDVQEAAVINLDTKDVMILDKTKSQYMALLLDVQEPKLSVTDTIKAIENVAAKVIDTHYDNPLNAINEFKNNVAESIARTSTIDVKEIMEQTFGEDEEVFGTCVQHMEEFSIQEAKVDVTDTKVKNKFSTQKLKTNTGIELKFPTHLFKDHDFMEVVNEPDGTLTIKIKNVSHIVNK